MLDRRTFLLGIAGVLLSSGLTHAHGSKFSPRRVRYSGYSPGTIVVDAPNRHLYLVEEGGYATRYAIGVGPASRNLKGRAVIGRKAEWPSWTPTSRMIRRSPEKYARYADGIPGGPGNPLGSRALYLYRGRRDTQYRIHGTNKPNSIGRAVSNGCIRMLDAHVQQLYKRVPVGTKVVIL